MHDSIFSLIEEEIALMDCENAKIQVNGVLNGIASKPVEVPLNKILHGFRPSTRIGESLHSGYSHPLVRKWQSRTQLTKSFFMLPLFVSDRDEDDEVIASLPGHRRRGIPPMLEYVKLLTEKGLRSVILFGYVSHATAKDDIGTWADQPQGPVIRAISALRRAFPDLFIAADVCLCEYTSHGHCGVLATDGHLDNVASVSRVADVAAAYAAAGAHCVAPSDMNDNRIAAVKNRLRECGLAHKTLLMSYAAKFSGCQYGPFREIAGSAPSFGDRRCYQLPPGGAGLARRAVRRDAQEGADVIMVKPALTYLDVLRDAAVELGGDYPLAAYQVSGEYAMIHAGAKAGVFGLREMAFETCEAIVRAGATVIVSYFTPDFLEWLDA